MSNVTIQTIDEWVKELAEFMTEKVKERIIGEWSVIILEDAIPKIFPWALWSQMVRSSSHEIPQASLAKSGFTMQFSFQNQGNIIYIWIIESS